MKVYKVKVNGKVYEVELESVEESSEHIIASAPVNVNQPTSVPSGAGHELKAPMAGTILEVKVKSGQAVKEGDVICILEAMKLQNEVVADVSGVIKAVFVEKGASVQNGDILVVIG